MNVHCSWAGVYCCSNQSLQGCAVQGGVYVIALGGFGAAGQIPDGALAPLVPSLQILSSEGEAALRAWAGNRHAPCPGRLRRYHLTWATACPAQPT